MKRDTVDARPPRFFAPEVLTTGGAVVLSADEGIHLARVLRLEPGGGARVFDGRGHEFDAVIEAVAKAGVTLRVGAAVTTPPEPAVAVTLAQAVLKGDKMDDVVRDAVMMGVAAIQPIITTRSETTVASVERARRRERWFRVAVASAKQCGRAVVPEILAPCDFHAAADALDHRTLPAPGAMLVEPSASVDAIGLAELDPQPPREITLLVGPEGGWTAEEIGRASSSCRLLTLGKRTVRADAMPIVALSALFAVWGQL